MSNNPEVPRASNLPSSSPPSPETAAPLRETVALIERATNWSVRLFDHEVAGHTPTPFESEAQEIIKGLLICTEPMPTPQQVSPETAAHPETIRCICGWPGDTSWCPVDHDQIQHERTPETAAEPPDNGFLGALAPAPPETAAETLIEECPFCGGTARADSSRHHVFCTKCHASTFEWATDAEARSKWNLRVQLVARWREERERLISQNETQAALVRLARSRQSRAEATCVRLEAIHEWARAVWTEERAVFEAVIARLEADLAALREALAMAAPHVCSFRCPSVKKTGDPWSHTLECEAITKALAAAPSAPQGEEQK